LTLDATKEQLKSAPDFKYDRSNFAWVPETSSCHLLRDATLEEWSHFLGGVAPGVDYFSTSTMRTRSTVFLAPSFRKMFLR
jgi:hypothetical protein